MAYHKKIAGITIEVNADTTQLVKDLDHASRQIEGLGQSFTSKGTSLTRNLTVPIATGFGASINSAVEWESAFTGVMKTVDESATTTYDDLKDSINEMAKSTASSQNDIAATMEIAGQLGVGADDIAEFTKTMVMLGDTTNLSSDEAASAIAKFANVTKMSLSDSDRLGSAIVDLGNNYATTESDIMNMATRLSGAGAQIGLSQGEILGFATALSSVGIEAEMGGSAFSKAMIKMQVATESGADGYEKFRQKLAEIQPEYAKLSSRDVQLWLMNDSTALKDVANATGYTKKELTDLINSRANLENFADVAGMTAEEFTKTFRDDAPGALQAFIKGLGNTEGKGESTIQMLQDMGFTEVRLRDTLTRLAQSGDLVTSAISQGNEAWEENSAMSEEAEKRYSTMETQFAQTKARLTEVAVSIGETVMPIVNKVLDFVDELMEKWNGLDDSQKETILKIAAIVAAVGPVLLIIGKVISAIGTVISIISALSAVFSVLSGPVLIVIGVIAALVAIGVLLYKNWDTIKEKCAELGEWLKEKWEAIKEAVSQAWENIKNAISQAWESIKSTVTNTLDSIKNFITEKWNAIKDTITGIIDGIKNAVSEKWESIKDGIKNSKIAEIVGNVWSAAKDKMAGFLDGMRKAYDSHGGGLKGAIAATWEGIKSYYQGIYNAINTLTGGKLGEMVSKVKEKMSSIFDSIKGTFDKVKDAIKNAIDFIKSLFTGSIDFPHINMPHFRIDGGQAPWGFGGQGYPPQIGIEWYKKAMNNAYMLDGASIFGSMNGKLLGGGETGSEMIIGTNKLLDMIARAKGGEMVFNNQFTINGTDRDPEELAREMSYYLNQEMRRMQYAQGLV